MGNRATSLPFSVCLENISKVSYDPWSVARVQGRRWHQKWEKRIGNCEMEKCRLMELKEEGGKFVLWESA